MAPKTDEQSVAVATDDYYLKPSPTTFEWCVLQPRQDFPAFLNEWLAGLSVEGWELGHVSGRNHYFKRPIRP